MSATTFSKRRVTLIALVAGAVAVLAPVAQADPGDAFTRALENQQSTPSFTGSPDAIDRALAAKEASKVAAIDARERALTERPSIGLGYSPDAFGRALVAHANGIDAQTVSMLDGRERALLGRPTPSEPIVATPGGFDWSDFGMGAGAGIGLMLVLLGLGAGALALRRDHSRVTTA